MSWLSQDFGPELFIAYNSDRIRVSTEQALAKKRYIALFFGGNWCNGCKVFLPLLIQAYNTRVSHHDVEVIFVSFCENDAAFQGCMGFMPWPAIPFDNKRIRENLRERYAISELPRVILLDGETGWVVNDSVHKIIQTTSSFNSCLPGITLSSSSSSSSSGNYTNPMLDDINMTDNISLSSSFFTQPNNHYPNTHPSFSSFSPSNSSSYPQQQQQYPPPISQPIHAMEITPTANNSSTHNNNNDSSTAGLPPLGCKGC